MLRALVLGFDAERRDILSQGLEAAGHAVIAPQASAMSLVRLVREYSPDLIIIDTDSPDRDTLEHIVMVSRDDPRPIVMFSGDADSAKIKDAVRAGVSAYIVNGLAADRVQPILDVAVARFAEVQALRAELASARAKLEDRKLLDRAKGILMQTRGLSEEEAYDTMRKLAMESSQRLVEIARQVVGMRSSLGRSK